MAIDLESEKLLQADSRGEGQTTEPSLATKRVFKPGQFYTTHDGHKPGRAPKGTKWQYRKDPLNDSLRNYYLVSKTSEVPTLDQLPLMDSRGDERTDLMVPLPGFDKRQVA
jgi:hypothetical protein